MEILKISEVKNLLSSKKDNSISIFIPTRKEWNNAEQNSIRFKNHLQKIETALQDKYLKAGQINEILKPARELLEDKDFWKHQNLGLAVFMSHGEFTYYRLPIELEETHYISNRYYIKPLLPLFSVDGSFYILSLDLNECKLYMASRYTVSEIPLPEKTRKSLSEEMQWDDPEKSLQFHTGTSAGNTVGGSRSAIFHGQGSGGIDEKIRKEKILEFFHTLNKGVFEKIGGQSIPLVLAGVEFLVPIYKEANSYPSIFKEAVTVDPQSLNDDELRQKAWDLLKPEFNKQRQTAADKYRRFSGNSLASSSTDEIVKAAYNKRIESLFVNISEQQWGSYNPETNEVQIDDAATYDNKDLLDYSAVHTILNNGFVYASTKEDMPCDKPLAAVYRY